MRLKTGKRRGGAICPASFPIPGWARAAVEQIAVDVSGMQPRFFYNDRPWLEQPAIYCSCYFVVTEAKRIVDEWVDDRKKKREAHQNVS
jgi:coproporphyrinogen III oxidase-like Fe-S oxidoreductase